MADIENRDVKKLDAQQQDSRQQQDPRQSDTRQPNSERPGAERAGTERPDSDKSDSGRPDSGKPDIARSDGERARTERAATERVATGRPEAGKTLGGAPVVPPPSAAPAPVRPSVDGADRASGQSSHGIALLAQDERDKLTLRLQHAVSGFVDGPKDSVEEADRVLAEVAERFTEAVERTRRTVRGSWQSGGGAAGDSDTEKLRLALRDYRELAERLLHS